MTTQLSDEDLLRNLLADTRGNVRIYRMTAANTENPDSKAMFEDIAKHDLEVAQALHRLLAKAGVKFLGETEGV